MVRPSTLVKIPRNRIGALIGPRASTKELIENGSVKGGYRTFNLTDDGVGYALNEYNDDKLASITDQLDEIKAMIVAGDIVVPDDDSKVKALAMDTF